MLEIMEEPRLHITILTAVETIASPGQHRKILQTLLGSQDGFHRHIQEVTRAPRRLGVRGKHLRKME